MKQPPNKLTFETLSTTLNNVGYLLERSRMPYFLCFGTLLGLIRDRNVIPNDTDIDLGIPEEHFQERAVMACFERFNYKVYKRIRRDDVDMFDPLSRHEDLVYISFVHDTLPCVDVFVWVLHKGIRYHTYDFLGENKERPSVYHWKGIKDEWLSRVERSFFGTNKEPLFERVVPFPLMYGHLLDHWYPDWKTPRPGESTTPWKLELKSCKQFKDKALISKQLEESRAKWEAELAAIR